METAQKMFENFISGTVEFQSVEIKMKHKNGNDIWVEANASNMLKNPEIKGIVINFRDIDEKKQAEETLNFNAMVFDQISDHIVVTDMKSRVRYCNDVVLKTLKRERHEIIGNKVEFFGDNPQKGATQDEISYTVSKVGLWEGEVVNYDSKGNEIIMSAKVQTVKDDSGKPIAMVGVSRDVSEKKKAEEELRESEERFKQFFKEHSAVKLIFDLESGNISEANKAAERFYGWTVEELKGMKIFDINTDPEELTRKNMKNVLKNGERHFIFKHRKKDGSIADIEVFSSTVNINGKPHAYSIIHDISEKKKAEKEVETLAQMLDVAPASITVHDEDGNFYYVNKITLDMHGYEKAEEFLKINLKDLDVPEFVEKLEERFKEINEKGEARFESGHYKKDGSSFPLDIYARKTNWYGKPAFISVAMDITERNKAERELRESEEKFRQLAESTSAAIFIHNGEEIQFVNNAATRYTGFTSDELIGMSPAQIVHPEDKESVMELWHKRDKGEDVPDTY